MTVRLFAQLREAAGGAAWACEVPAGASVRDAWDAAVGMHPALAPFARGIACAVNAEFATMTSRIQEGDEVAFLPPVSGG